MIAFVTVGSTAFDPLVEAAISDEFIEALLKKGFKKLVVQRGGSNVKLKDITECEDALTVNCHGIEVELWRYKPSLRTEMEVSDLVISHAGSGTIVEALRLHKPLIVVPNPTLLDDHQQELAQALDDLGHLKTSTISDLARTLRTLDTRKVVAFPPIDGSQFARLVDEEMGYHRVLLPRSMARDIIPIVVDVGPEEYEDVHVHSIYDNIADHFSSTRYKPWPIIANFLSEIPTGWVGLDAGTGNGKYLSLPPQPPGKIWSIGLDRSINLLRIARSAGGITREVVLGNVLDHCWRKGCFDFAISIATIHHLATSERRRAAIQRLLEVVSPNHGRVLIYVWAIEQDELSKRNIPTNAECSTSGQDVLIPWVSSDREHDTTNAHNVTTRVYNRYYHMFAEGELLDLVKSAAQESGLELESQPGSGMVTRGVEIVRKGWERSNYYIELRLWQVG